MLQFSADHGRSPLPRRSLLVLAAAALCLLTIPRLHAAQPAAAQTGAEESWDAIFLAGERIGYAHNRQDTIERDGRSIIRNHTHQSISITRFGQTTVMITDLVTEETVAGGLESFVFEMANPPAGSTRTVGRVAGNTLELETTIGGQTQKKTQPWDPEIKSPAFLDESLTRDPLKPGDKRTFKMFLPDLTKVTNIELRAIGPKETSLYGGQRAALLEVEMSQSVLPFFTTRLFMDGAGDVQKSTTNMIGTEMATYTVSREEALKDVSGAEVDLALNTLVPVDRIPPGHRSQRVVYRVTSSEGDPVKLIPAGPAQQLRPLGDQTAELTVTAIPLPAQATVANAPDGHLAATPYLQSTDARVKAHADKAAGSSTDPALVARQMESYVHQTLTNKNFSTALASAGEVARSLEGDCTEHAVLLAAMLRAKGIPSRIAVGLVYVDHAPGPGFGGHMWTEAWLGGKWVPLDATLGQGGTGACHIKLGDSPFNDTTPIESFLGLISVLGNLSIEVVEAK